ncbi:protein kilB [Streptomyces sp. NPDC090126]|uniref:protein kilB n=1 Tax=Streptomyces sp. NPDC090126 TaxID=3365952 RepID=UPI0037F4ECC6
MLATLLTAILAIVGTLAGSVVTAVLQRRSAQASQAAADRTAHRREQLAAVTALASALAAHGAAMWAREEKRLKGGDWSAARETSHATRAAITSPEVQLRVLAPTLAQAAAEAAEAVYALRDAKDLAELETARARARAASDRFITEAGALLSV